MKNKDKLLLICPTRRRAEDMHLFLSGIKSTVDLKYTVLLVLLDEDDTDLERYVEELPNWAESVVCDKHEHGTTEIINKAFNDNQDYKFYSVINDDMFYDTVGWDKMLSVKGKINCGYEPYSIQKYGRIRNGVDVEGFPYTSVIDGDIVRALGWLQYPELQHCCGDNVWYWIGRRLKILNYVKEVKYRHEHYYLGRREVNETYAKNRKIARKDYRRFMNWLKYKIDDDLSKIRFGGGKMEYVSISGDWVEKIKHQEKKKKEIKECEVKKDKTKKTIVKKKKSVKVNTNKKKGE